MRKTYTSQKTFILTDDISEFIPYRVTLMPWDGTWELLKGDSTDQSAEQSQNTFDSQLMTLFTQQYGNQQQQLQFLQKQLEPQLSSGGQGYTAAQLAAQRTGASDTNAQQLQNEQQALGNQISQAGGGGKLASVAGDAIEAKAGLLSAAGQAEAGAQNQITTNNATLQQNNYWNAINALNGVAAQENPLGYANSATSGTNAVAGASQAYTASNQSQLLGALGGVAGGVGSALGGGFTKGGLFGCWIAASFYGWNNVRTWILRKWLHTSAPKWFRNLYLTHGESISRTAIRWAFRPVFEYVLVNA